MPALSSFRPAKVTSTDKKVRSSSKYKGGSSSKSSSSSSSKSSSSSSSKSSSSSSSKISSSSVEIKYFKPDGTAVYGNKTARTVIPEGARAASGATISTSPQAKQKMYYTNAQTGQMVESSAKMGGFNQTGLTKGSTSSRLNTRNISPMQTKTLQATRTPINPFGSSQPQSIKPNLFKPNNYNSYADALSAAQQKKQKEAKQRSNVEIKYYDKNDKPVYGSKTENTKVPKGKKFAKGQSISPLAPEEAAFNYATDLKILQAKTQLAKEERIASSFLDKKEKQITQQIESGTYDVGSFATPDSLIMNIEGTKTKVTSKGLVTEYDSSGKQNAQYRVDPADARRALRDQKYFELASSKGVSDLNSALFDTNKSLDNRFKSKSKEIVDFSEKFVLESNFLKKESNKKIDAINKWGKDTELKREVLGQNPIYKGTVLGITDADTKRTTNILGLQLRESTGKLLLQRAGVSLVAGSVIGGGGFTTAIGGTSLLTGAGAAAGTAGAWVAGGAAVTYLGYKDIQLKTNRAAAIGKGFKEKGIKGIGSGWVDFEKSRANKMINFFSKEGATKTKKFIEDKQSTMAKTIGDVAGFGLGYGGGAYATAEAELLGPRVVISKKPKITDLGNNKISIDRTSTLNIGGRQFEVTESGILQRLQTGSGTYESTGEVLLSTKVGKKNINTKTKVKILEKTDRVLSASSSKQGSFLESSEKPFMEGFRAKGKTYKIEQSNFEDFLIKDKAIKYPKKVSDKTSVTIDKTYDVYQPAQKTSFLDFARRSRSKIVKAGKDYKNTLSKALDKTKNAFKKKPKVSDDLVYGKIKPPKKSLKPKQGEYGPSDSSFDNLFKTSRGGRTQIDETLVRSDMNPIDDILGNPKRSSSSGGGRNKPKGSSKTGPSEFNMPKNSMFNTIERELLTVNPTRLINPTGARTSLPGGTSNFKLGSNLKLGAGLEVPSRVNSLGLNDFGFRGQLKPISQATPKSVFEPMTDTLPKLNTDFKPRNTQRGYDFNPPPFRPPTFIPVFGLPPIRGSSIGEPFDFSRKTSKARTTKYQSSLAGRILKIKKKKTKSTITGLEIRGII